MMDWYEYEPGQNSKAATKWHCVCELLYFSHMFCQSVTKVLVTEQVLYNVLILK